MTKNDERLSPGIWPPEQPRTRNFMKVFLTCFLYNVMQRFREKFDAPGTDGEATARLRCDLRPLLRDGK